MRPRVCNTSQHAIVPSGTLRSPLYHTLSLFAAKRFTAIWQTTHAATPKTARSAIIHSAIDSGRRSVRITF